MADAGGHYDYKERKHGDLGLYSVLGLDDVFATRTEIRNAAKRMLVYHDDLVVRKFNEREKMEEKETHFRELHTQLKSREEADPALLRQFSELGVELERLNKERDTLRAEAKKKWNNVCEAKEILLDRVKRKIYDMENFPNKQDRSVAREELTLMYQNQANMSCENMREQVAKILKQEGEDGLIILEARYGDLMHTMAERPGAYIDVRIPLQAMVGQVERSVLDYSPPSSRNSYSLLKGFYNPLCVGGDRKIDDEDMFLEIVYKYRARLHVAEFYDGDPFVLPRKEHLCEKHETINDLGWRVQERKRCRRETVKTSLSVLVGIVGLGGIFWWCFGRFTKSKEVSKPSQHVYYKMS
eukprot:jgi/Bigna1/68975/fgenesh1_pg.7_\